MAASRAHTRKRLKALRDLVQPERLTEIVDVGANPMNEPDYRPMLGAGVARVTGFEPQPSAFEKLADKQTDVARYLPYAIGDGGVHTLNICRSSGMTSMLKPDRSTFMFLNRFLDDIEVLERHEMSTHRLDDLNEIEVMDLLKIDIQGGEVAVFENATGRLQSAVAVMTEVAFVPLYEGQPLLDQQMKTLRDQGFQLHKFMFSKALPLRSGIKTPLRRSETMNQLIDGDAVFIRDLRQPDAYSDEDLKHLALLADGCFASFDLTARCLSILVDRKVLKEPQLERYFALH